MATDLEVSTGMLRTTARQLREAVAVAEEVHSQRGRLRLLSEGVGHGEAEAALGDFVHAWSYGLGLVRKDAATLADLLGRAAGAYEQLEQQIAGACRG